MANNRKKGMITIKHLKRLIISLLILFFLTVFVSVETDFFSDIEKHLPQACERYPWISQAAQGIEEMTENIPSFSQLRAAIVNEPLPVDSADLAKGTYNKNSPMLNFYSDETVGVLMKDGNQLSVFGISKDSDKSHILVQITDSTGNELSQESFAASNISFEFQKYIKIPETDSNVLNINIYTGDKEYGEFNSWAADYIKIVKNSDGTWHIQESPVKEHNMNMYEQGKPLSYALSETEAIKPDSSAVMSIARQITDGIENDYDKLLAIHDWVCGYLYYNIDYVNDSKTAPYEVDEVLSSRKVVCLGYSNLFASLCRSIKIPCYVVSGYALGIDSASKSWNDKNSKITSPNHAWNEAYVNGRWVIIDTTWDSFNTYENEKMNKAEKISHLYFDANPEFFSANHKIIEYLKS